MNTKLKDYLLAAGTFALVAFSLSAIWFVASYSKAAEPASFRSFMVQGQGKVSIIPDIAQFSFGVVTQGGIDLAATQEQNTQNTNAAVAFLKEQGIEEKDIATKNYSVEPRYQYENCPDRNTVCPPPDIVGYTVRQQVQVKVRNFGILGGLLSGIVEKGTNTVSELSFTIDDPTLGQNEARKQAIEKAQAKAKAMAEAGGFRVGRLLSIQEGALFAPRYDIGALEATSGAPSPGIEPGSREVQVTVTLTYEIE